MIEPLKDLYTFEGQARIRKTDESVDVGKQEAIRLDISQFLHRGAVLKNSERVLCLVVQTGQ